MEFSVVNEKELGKAIGDAVAPRLAEAQERLENWAAGLLAGNTIRLTIPLGERTVQVLVDLIPKP